MLSGSIVVLHVGQPVTLLEYLGRVLASLLAFAGVGVALFWAVRVVGHVQSAGGVWGENHRE